MSQSEKPGHAVLSEPVPENFKREIDDRIKGELERHAQRWKDRLKYGALGFGLFIVALPLGADDIVRTLHEKAFPNEVAQNGPLISFGSGIELRVGDPKAETSFMSFYAEPNQRVHLYLTINPRFVGVNGVPPRVVVSV